MTPDLISAVLALPLPVRLALLDADPNGAGWLVPVGALESGYCYVAMRVTPYERGQVRGGAAWLPCNPLAIVEHAIKTYAGTADWYVSRASGTGEWVVWVHSWTGVGCSRTQLHKVTGACPHTAALALLREVVG